MLRISLVFLLVVFGAVTIPLARGQHLTSAPHIGVEQVPIGSPVYAFLRHLSVKGIIHGYSEAELPISEYEVEQFLHQAETVRRSGAGQELLRKYLRTYGHEPRDAVTVFPSNDAEPLFFRGLLTDKDKYLYQWYDDSTHSDFFVHGVASAELRHKTDPVSESVGLLNLGGGLSGTLSGHVGYFLQSTNGAKFGSTELALEDPLLASNHNFLYFTNQTFFDFTTAELAYNYDWFTAKIAREAIGIGGGYQNDNVIISPNVPNYDFVSLAAHVGAVRYEALLASLVPDTVADSITGPGIPQKYMALHDLTFLLGDNLELGFTDDIIFGQRVVLGYLNPLSFLKIVEHGQQDEDKDNSQMSLHARWGITPGLEVRGQMLVDDIVFGNIGSGYWSNKLAWQFGAMWSGAFGISDLDWEAEWIRVEPYTYTHWAQDDDRYTTSNTLLGAQIGPNAESLWTMLRWVPDAHWTFSLSGELIARGENIYDSSGNLLYNAGANYNLSIDTQQTQNNTHFLEGRRVNIINITADIEYEPWRDITFFMRGTKTAVNYLSEAPATPGFNLSGLPVSYAPQSLPETIVAAGAQVMF